MTNYWIPAQQIAGMTGWVDHGNDGIIDSRPTDCWNDEVGRPGNDTVSFVLVPENIAEIAGGQYSFRPVQELLVVGLIERRGGTGERLRTNTH